MSAVDVLGMLELAYAVAKQSGLQGDARDYMLAHAAVAELIEAARPYAGPTLKDRKARDLKRLRAALARCKGAQACPRPVNPGFCCATCGAGFDFGCRCD